MEPARPTTVPAGTKAPIANGVGFLPADRKGGGAFMIRPVSENVAVANWPKMAQAIQKIDSARAAGLEIRADMYTYPAGATGLDAAMPPWVQEGGLQAWIGRLRDPAVRKRVAQEMRTPTDRWENLLLAAGSPGEAAPTFSGGVYTASMMPYALAASGLMK